MESWSDHVPAHKPQFTRCTRRNQIHKAREFEQQGATIARQQKQIDALTAGLQKVSAQLELSKPEPQTVLNSQ